MCRETSRLGLRNPVADEIKCGPHGGRKSKTKSCTVSWLSFETKTEPGRPWRPSPEWRLAWGYTKSPGFVVVHHKTTRLLGWATKPRLKTLCSKQTETSLTGWLEGVRNLQSQGHTTWSQGLCSGYTGLRWMRICPMVLWWEFSKLKASRPLIRVLIINDNHYGLTFLFKL
jgi:hypothetical protein